MAKFIRLDRTLIDAEKVVAAILVTVRGQPQLTIHLAASTMKAPLVVRGDRALAVAKILDDTLGATAFDLPPKPKRGKAGMEITGDGEQDDGD